MEGRDGELGTAKNYYEVDASRIYWQAHRGGGAYEAPDNTMGANLYAWKLGGIPEADLRTTKDGVIVCLHDLTPARTTNAPDEGKNQPINSLTFEQTRAWDAGQKFSPAFAGETIPSLEEVFEAMRYHSERQVYLDLKDVDLQRLGELIERYEVNRQVIFAHNNQGNCIRMKEIADGVRTMLWIGGNADKIQHSYQVALDSGFRGLDQVQFHLNGFQSGADWPYELDRELIERVLTETLAAGVDLELLPFQFDTRSIHGLLDLGVRWYATDEPAKFVTCLQSYSASYEGGSA
jgi:glycerophosphoryl diester phosphodiesterase